MSKLPRNQNEQLNRLAKDVLKLDRNTLLVNLRFMDRALSQLTLVNHKGLSLATDGRYLVYDPTHVLKVFKNEKNASVRDYLHIIMHCIYRHMYIHSLMDNELWDLACDIAVEKTITDLGLKSTETSRDIKQSKVFDELSQELNIITAQKIYHHYLNQDISEKRITELSKLFKADDHMLWYMNEDAKNELLGISGHEEDSTSDNESQRTGSDGKAQNGESQLQQAVTMAAAEASWKDISEHMQMDLETFSKQAGDKAGSLTQNLREVNREKYNYESFLRRFAVRGEVMKLDMDEFDYIFYTYGLKLYGNVPLIEPLEYKEVDRIREFVIAIDTSGSTSGDLVQAFIQKTYNILKSTESFFSRINLHIIQCDADIQEDAKITNQDEFDEYLKHMELRGLGGTDFRPVFEYVDLLRERKEFQNLGGMIYFTDGWGSFPAHAPEYETAFVFVDDGMNNYEVPSWAMKLILQKEEIRIS